MATLSIWDVDETSLTFNVAGLDYAFTTANYTQIGLSTRSFVDGSASEPSGTFWSGTVGDDVAATGVPSTPDVEITHGLSAGDYTIYAWALFSNGRYYGAGISGVDIPEEYLPSTYQFYGGHGGGAAVGNNGDDGAGTRRNQSGGDGADSLIDGADADYGGSNSSTYYGYGNGGNGGHGGGGGGGGGYNTKTGGDSGGNGGVGSDGGYGAPGCVLIYY